MWSMPSSRENLQVVPEFKALLSQVGLDGQSVFSHPQIKVWRSIAERENCILNTPSGRLHIKRYRSRRGAPAEWEVKGIEALVAAGIGTVKLGGWGGG